MSWRTGWRLRRARQTADDLIWEGNVELLQHEQRALVQPNFDRLSCAFARLISIGSATSFEVRGVRKEVAYFTSFYLYSLTRGIPHALRAQTWPRITRFDDRWRWLVASIVPRSGDSMPTRAWSTPACDTSSTKRATSRRPPAYCRVHPQTGVVADVEVDGDLSCCGRLVRLDSGIRRWTGCGGRRGARPRKRPPRRWPPGPPPGRGAPPVRPTRTCG